MVFLVRIMTCMAMVHLLSCTSIHWEIDWNNSNNLVSGSYASKNIIPRLSKLDNIVKKRVAEPDAEIEQNFTILMVISAMMSMVLVMSIHGFYLACKRRVDDALPIATKPVASRVPVIRSTHVPMDDSPKAIEMELKNPISAPTWVDSPYRC